MPKTTSPNKYLPLKPIFNPCYFSLDNTFKAVFFTLTYPFRYHFPTLLTTEPNQLLKLLSI
jgi:hypothetical protein